MRHVDAADLHANAVELNAAIDAGDEVTVMVEGREYRLVPLAPDESRDDSAAVVERRRAALDDLQRLRAELRENGVRVSAAEVREWINDGRP